MAGSGLSWYYLGGIEENHEVFQSLWHVSCFLRTDVTGLEFRLATDDMCQQSLRRHDDSAHRHKRNVAATITAPALWDHESLRHACQ
jgi:hypothetical protein